MTLKNEDLHGNVPDKSPVALLLIDVLNDLEFEGGELLVKHALPMAKRLAALKRRAKAAGIPAIYINDNFGKWQSDWQKLLEHTLQPDIRGRPMVELLKPEESDYMVLKPKQSGFFSTTLDVLLKYLQAHTLIISGVAGNICVLFTAADAYMRDFQIIIPEDCVASNEKELNQFAIEQMRTVLKAEIVRSTDLDLQELRHTTP